MKLPRDKKALLYAEIGIIVLAILLLYVGHKEELIFGGGHGFSVNILWLLFFGILPYVVGLGSVGTLGSLRLISYNGGDFIYEVFFFLPFIVLYMVYAFAAVYRKKLLVALLIPFHILPGLYIFPAILDSLIERSLSYAAIFATTLMLICATLFVYRVYFQRDKTK